MDLESISSVYPSLELAVLYTQMCRRAIRLFSWKYLLSFLSLSITLSPNFTDPMHCEKYSWDSNTSIYDGDEKGILREDSKTD